MKKTFIIILFVLLTWGIYFVSKFIKNKDEFYNLQDKNKKLHPYFKDDYYAKKCLEGKVLDIYLDMFIKGRVIGKYKMLESHNEPLIWIEDLNYFYDIRPSNFNENGKTIYEEIKVGDSIFKNKGSLIFSIKRDTLVRNINVTFIEKYCINPYYKANTDKLNWGSVP